LYENSLIEVFFSDIILILLRGVVSFSQTAIAAITLNLFDHENSCLMLSVMAEERFLRIGCPPKKFLEL
jgi:hypothetical protein